jgi:hypothetical protein
VRALLCILVAAPLLLLACSLSSAVAETVTPPATAAAQATEAPPGATGEAIRILEPGPGSRLVSPLSVRVQTTLPAFERTLTLRVLSDDGRDLIGPQAVVATGEEGGRLSFSATLPFSVSEERTAFLQAYLTSPRDGGVTHLASTWVRLIPAGEAVIEPASADATETLQILLPAAGESIHGGVVHVEGIGLASFEQTLLIEVHDAAGAILGLQPVLVQAPDWGIAGPFSADVPYTLTAAGPGRIVVRDISPAHGDDVHRASVEIELAP